MAGAPGYRSGMKVQLLRDPRRFSDVSAEWLAADPLSTNVIAVNLDAVLRGERPAGDDALWVVVSDGGRVVGAAMHTPPYHLALPRLPAGAAAAIAVSVLDAGHTPGGAIGVIPSVAEFVEAWTGRTGGTSQLLMAMRLYRLEKLVAPVAISGTARLAEDGDRALVTRWLDQFHREADPGRPGDPIATVVERRLAARQLWLWCEGTTPVAMAGHSATASGIARVGPVYTPPEHRRQGFGAAVTAAATQATLVAGATHVVLYTDLANPTSNSIYQAIGYLADHDAEDRQLVAR